MIGILDRITESLHCRKVRRLESELYNEITKRKQLADSLQTIYNELSVHKNTLGEVHKMLDKYSEGLRVLGEAIEQLSTNNNETVPKILQLQTNQLQLARNLQRLTEVLIEADVINRILPDFDRMH